MPLLSAKAAVQLPAPGATGLPEELASATYDANNRLTQWGTTALSYDDAGNLTIRRHSI